MKFFYNKPGLFTARYELNYFIYIVQIEVLLVFQDQKSINQFVASTQMAHQAMQIEVKSVGCRLMEELFNAGKCLWL